MSKRVSLLLAMLALMLLAPLAVSAQQQEPPTFTYVSEWAVPRAQWADWVAYAQKNTKPIFEKAMADGTIIGWGMYTTVVHDDSGITHGSWYEATSIAAIEKVGAELAKLPQNTILTAATKHRDYLLRSTFHRSKAASGSNGYLWVNATQIQPGKGQQWRELWDKYNKPYFEELHASGTLLAYWIDVEQVHTENPGWVYVVYTAASADAVDKVGSGLAARAQKRSPEENRAIGEAFAGVTVAGTHRDFFARVSHYSQK